ncbi:MAG: hypothetical protein JWN87_1700 [Frankiales bacterium]|nr:hypothetical protein [Frankiales bacterium]
MIVYRQWAGSDVKEIWMSLRRVVTAFALSMGATAALVGSAAPANADGCGRVAVPGHDTVEVCNLLIKELEDLKVS